MGTLLMQLIAPMQSWGIQSNFTYRDTALEPSKSGVIGLVSAAMGVPRDDDETLARLARLKMGVRVDREGLVKYDYHTAGKPYKPGGPGYLRAKGTIERKNLIESWRYYLADAAFLVGLESDDDWGLLLDVHHQLQHPVWPLYLGRKAFTPSEPVWIKDGGLYPNKDLESALREYPRLRPKRNPYDDDRMRAMLEDRQGEIVRPDQPLSFAKGKRQFTLRRLHVEFFDDQPLRKDFRHVSIAPYS